MKHVLSTHLIVNHRLNTVWLDRIWKAGFPAVEIFCARQHLDYRDNGQINELANWFADAEIQFHSLHAPMYTDEVWGRSGPHSVISITETAKARRNASVDEIKRALEIAEKIPFRYLIQHLGVGGEEYDERKLDAAFNALDEIKIFAKQRGVEVLLENIPNGFSSASRLLNFLELTHLDLNFCFDVGHAHIAGGVETEYKSMQHRIRSTHIHDNDGTADIHLFPLHENGGTVDWKKTMTLLRSRPEQYPLLLELREVEGMPSPLNEAKSVIERLAALETVE
ncbi:MAG TPA: sugar phosphate isomerase/epimerase family protein [Bryobacteraceae bacterium]|nr:sugar phosphate isomerase/epimerase family protein [Bryobacteraceae bacterium]